MDVKKEVIVVDDGSDDGTKEILRNIKMNSLKTVFHERNRGKGAAIRTGLKYVTGDIVIIQDADLEYDPQEYPKLIQPIVEGKAKVVYGSRFLQPLTSNNIYYHFVLGVKLLNTLLFLLFLLYIAISFLHFLGNLYYFWIEEILLILLYLNRMKIF